VTSSLDSVVTLTGYSREHNSWKRVSDILALDLIAKFYYKHSAAFKYICQINFDTIFRSRTIALRHSNLKEGISIKRPYQYYLWNTGPTP